MDSNEKQRRREIERRRENEQRDLEVERTIGERPLEGLSSGHTTWTSEQNDEPADREAAHGRDEERSRRASEEQIPDEP